MLSREQKPERLPDARLTTIIKNNVVGQGSGKPGAPFFEERFPDLVPKLRNKLCLFLPCIGMTKKRRGLVALIVIGINSQPGLKLSKEMDNGSPQFN